MFGKAVNLKKRVASHFSGHKITPQRQHFLRDIYGISFEVCSTELFALLLECSEIKKLWPIYNKALKRFEPKYMLYGYEARNGYRYLAIGKMAGYRDCIEVFHSKYDGVTLLLNLASQFGIDQRFCIYGRQEEENRIQQDLAALPDPEYHNGQIERAIDSIKKNRPSFAIIDKGRDTDELSCIWVENGHFYGMGYIPSDLGFTKPSETKDYLTPYKSNQYIMQLLYSFAEKYPGRVIFQKDTEVN